MTIKEAIFKDLEIGDDVFDIERHVRENLDKAERIIELKPTARYNLDPPAPTLYHHSVLVLPDGIGVYRAVPKSDNVKITDSRGLPDAKEFIKPLNADNTDFVVIIARESPKSKRKAYMAVWWEPNETNTSASEANELNPRKRRRH